MLKTFPRLEALNDSLQDTSETFRKSYTRISSQKSSKYRLHGYVASPPNVSLCTLLLLKPAYKKDSINITPLDYSQHHCKSYSHIQLINTFRPVRWENSTALWYKDQY